MSEPNEHDKPEDTPGGRPETPPGQEGEQPGNRPDVPPGHDPNHPDKPDEGEEEHPAHPIAEPEATAAPAQVEALMGLRDYLAVAPQRRSAASTQAASAALQRWMRLHGQDTNGFYTMAAWQSFYDETMADTGGTR